jgi:hypothetical protein
VPLLARVTVTVTVTDDLLNTKLLSPVSRQLRQPVQSPNYMQCDLSVKVLQCVMQHNEAQQGQDSGVDTPPISFFSMFTGVFVCRRYVSI